MGEESDIASQENDEDRDITNQEETKIRACDGTIDFGMKSKTI